jgi:mono/diheme cytochrome c family protein
MIRLMMQMTVRRSDVAALILATVLFGISSPAYSATGSVVLGRLVAEAYCTLCHAIGPTGASPHAPAPPFRTLHEKYDVEGFAEMFAEGIVVGHPGPRRMPKLLLSRTQIDNLIAYLKSLEPARRAPTGSPRQALPRGP